MFWNCSAKLAKLRSHCYTMLYNPTRVKTQDLIWSSLARRSAGILGYILDEQRQNAFSELYMNNNCRKSPSRHSSLLALALYPAKRGAIRTVRGFRLSASRFGSRAPARSAASFAFLRFLISSSGQRWQCAHESPLLHPAGLWNQAHGLHFPVPCSAEPAEGTGRQLARSMASLGDSGETGEGAPKGSHWASKLELCIGEVPRSNGVSTVGSENSLPRNIDAGVCVIMESIADRGVQLVPPHIMGLPGSFCIICFALRLFLISSWGHKWQWRQSIPLSQPFGFQNHAQGLQKPVPCNFEPSEGKTWAAASALSVPIMKGLISTWYFPSSSSSSIWAKLKASGEAISCSKGSCFARSANPGGGAMAASVGCEVGDGATFWGSSHSKDSNVGDMPATPGISTFSGSIGIMRSSWL